MTGQNNKRPLWQSMLTVIPNLLTKCMVLLDVKHSHSGMRWETVSDWWSHTRPHDSATQMRWAAITVYAYFRRNLWNNVPVLPFCLLWYCHERKAVTLKTKIIYWRTCVGTKLKQKGRKENHETPKRCNGVSVWRVAAWRRSEEVQLSTPKHRLSRPAWASFLYTSHAIWCVMLTNTVDKSWMIYNRRKLTNQEH